MQAKTLLDEFASTLRVAAPVRLDGQSVEQDRDAALVSEPLILGEARFVEARSLLILAEDVSRSAVCAQRAGAQAAGQLLGPLEQLAEPSSSFERTRCRP